LYKVTGQYLFSEKGLNISTNGLSTGIYVLELQIIQGVKSVKK